MTSPPARGWAKRQSQLLVELRNFDKTRLRPVGGESGDGALASPLRKLAKGVHEEEDGASSPRTPQQLAILRLAALRKAAKADSRPARVASGLYVGGIGAARNLKALRKAGITHVVNASPVVPCFFAENPEGAFEYLGVPLYDDAEADLLAHVAHVSKFIQEARSSGGRVLVHCFAGQSRSVALIMAHLMSVERLGLLDAWAACRRARPCARPNAGFLAQLASYGQRLGLPGADEDAVAIEGLDLSQL